MFSLNRLDRDDRPKRGGYLSGRGSQAEFSICIGMLALISLVFPEFVTGGGAGLMTVLAVRRLHDFGRTGWWVALPLSAGIGASAVMIAVPPMQGLAQAAILTGGALCASIIGLMPGDVGTNRFGDPTPSRRKKAALSRTFT